jgi:hypothetical protein
MDDLTTVLVMERRAALGAEASKVRHRTDSGPSGVQELIALMPGCDPYLVRRSVARWERFFRSFVDESILVVAKNLLFGLDPVF